MSETLWLDTGGENDAPSTHVKLKSADDDTAAVTDAAAADDDDDDDADDDEDDEDDDEGCSSCYMSDECLMTPNCCDCNTDQLPVKLSL